MVWGVERTDTFVVEDRLLTDVGGTLGFSVLSTPGMIAMMERCAAMLALEQLEDGQATVGFEVCVKHVAGAGAGASPAASISGRRSSCICSVETFTLIGSAWPDSISSRACSQARLRLAPIVRRSSSRR